MLVFVFECINKYTLLAGQAAAAPKKGATAPVVESTPTPSPPSAEVSAPIPTTPPPVPPKPFAPMSSTPVSSIKIPVTPQPLPPGQAESMITGSRTEQRVSIRKSIPLKLSVL